jgi:hypothetical protein
MKSNGLIFVIFLFLFTVFLDFFFGKIYEALYFSEKSRSNDRLIHSVLGTNEDVLIFGSSRALHHYNPKILEDSLGLTAYNVGSGGQNIYFHNAILEAALERYVPKIVILELMSIDFEKTPLQWDTEKLGTLLPFSNLSSASRNAVLLRGSEEQIKLFSSIYPYNSMQYNMLRNNLLPFENHLKGFIPLNGVWTKGIETREILSSDIDPNKVKALYHFIETCKKNNIELYIFISPHYANFNGKSRYTELTNQLLIEYGLHVMNYENDSIFVQHPEFFVDPFHLNSEGAKVYSSIAASKILSSF